MIQTPRLLAQLKDDEGFAPRARWDVKQFSYGYGCRAPGEGTTITEPEAARLLEKKMRESVGYFHAIFADHLHKFNDVRAEAFVNLIFNMGPGKKGDPRRGGLQSFVNTLGLITDYPTVDWGRVADNLSASLWFRQVRNSGDDDGTGPDEGRGVRIVRQVRTGIY